MGRIRVMDPHLAAKIAAGEVIERPASVVKELVENALDAGASWVRVEVEGGGLERIMVADNGAGIASEDVELAFRRHATSKITHETDLDRLATLGFRGEALPSIAAVADVRCVTRAADEAVGTELQFEEGAFERRSVARGEPGTTFHVDGLFGRFPARRKFQRARGTESAACVQAVGPLALSFPEVQFEVLVDGRGALRTRGDGDLRATAAAVLGADVQGQLVEVDELLRGDDDEELVRVSGLCGTGWLHRGSRSALHLVVNRRPIQNRALSFAVQEAYGSLLPVGRYPVTALRIQVPPGEVDFNVHPSKLEVRLLRERAVYASVQQAIRGALASDAWQVPVLEEAATASPDLFGQADLLAGGERLGELRVLGQAGSTYVVAEGDAGVYLVDQHAAHERVLLEGLRRSLTGRVDRQLLLEPAVVAVPPAAVAQVQSAQTELGALGFEMEPFGPGEVLVRSVPAVLAQRRPAQILGEALSALVDGTHGLVVEQGAPWSERLALVLACKTAVRAGDELDRGEMEGLLRSLGDAALCRTCAHGRPTAILLDFPQLERAFGRR